MGWYQRRVHGDFSLKVGLGGIFDLEHSGKRCSKCSFGCMTTLSFFSSSIPLYCWTRNHFLLRFLLSSGPSLCSPLWEINYLETRESRVLKFKHNQHET